MEESAFVKIIVVGEQNVGKTCILARYSRDQFDTTCPPTLGMDFQSKLLEHKGNTFRLQLWDIAGQERYNAVSKLYVRGAAGAIVVTDVKNESSLDGSVKWKSMIEEFSQTKDGKNIPIMLVQNKSDELKGLGEIQPFQTIQYLKQFAEKNGFSSVLQTSAKDNTNINELFVQIVDQIIAKGIVVAPQENKYSKPAATVSQGTQNNAPSPKVPQQQQQNQQSSSLRNPTKTTASSSSGSTCC